MRGLYQRLKSFIVLIKHYDRYIIAPSYYMEYEHKSSVRIFLEQLYFILRYRDFEPIILPMDLIGKTCQFGKYVFHILFHITFSKKK